MQQQQGDVTIRITKNEALVLFAYLSRLNEQTSTKDFEHQADQIVLWNIEAVLEAELPEVLQHDYLEVIQNARESFSLR
jgi:hypothetical protein